MSSYSIQPSDYIGQTVKVHVDRPLGTRHPKHDFVYECNYGYIPNTLAPDGEEIDAYIIGINEPLDDFEGVCIAVIHRENDDDDKLVVVPEGKNPTDEEIRRTTHFQEQWFKSVVLRKKP